MRRLLLHSQLRGGGRGGEAEEEAAAAMGLFAMLGELSPSADGHLVCLLHNPAPRLATSTAAEQTQQQEDGGRGGAGASGPPVCETALLPMSPSSEKKVRFPVDESPVSQTIVSLHLLETL